MRPTATTAPPDDPFYYGFRDVVRDGDMVRMPLTLEDCLYPREGDHISNNLQHNIDCRYLATTIEARLLAAAGPALAPHTLVMQDTLVEWGVAGIGNHSPDVALFVGLNAEPDRYTGTLRLRQFGGRCALAVEVVSPSTRINDVVTKLDHYFRVGVQFYVIIDQEHEDGPRAVRAYRWAPAGYVEVNADAQGRILLPVLGLLLGLRDNVAVCFDAATGEEIHDLAHTRERFAQFREEAEQNFAEQADAMRELRQDADDERRKREDAEKLVRELQEKLRLLQAGASGDPANPPA